MSEEELRQRLVELGQGPYLAGAPIWNLDKVKTLGDLAAFQKGGADYDDGATGSESLEGLSSPCLRRTDWPEPEMRTLLKRCVYIRRGGPILCRHRQAHGWQLRHARPAVPRLGHWGWLEPTYSRRRVLERWPSAGPSRDAQDDR
jgi:hypothetical protein